MMLASAYLGGAYFFLRVVFESRWNVVKTGFLSVALFASLLGVATSPALGQVQPSPCRFLALGWPLPDRTDLGVRRLARATGASLRRHALTSNDGEQLGTISRWIVGLLGLIALGQGIVMFVAPSQVIPIWPWILTPLTCRVVGAIFCLGSAGLAVLADSRWTTLRLLLQVEALMVTLILVGAVRARAEFNTGRPLSWILLSGFVAVLLGSGYLWYTMEIRARP